MDPFEREIMLESDTERYEAELGRADDFYKEKAIRRNELKNPEIADAMQSLKNGLSVNGNVYAMRLVDKIQDYVITLENNISHC
jgi:hypothetical protein